MQRAVEYIGLLDQTSRASKVFVKPNLTFPRATPGVTTTPQFLHNLLAVLAQTGAEVFVGESNGGYGSFLATAAFEGHELPRICKQTKTTLVNLSESEKRVYSRVKDGVRGKVLLPRFLAEEVDFTISVPVLKVHAMTTVSLSVKNLWGCVPNDLRLLEHASLNHQLALIGDLIRARFGVIDATYGLDSHGPMIGRVREFGKIIAGDDLYGLDRITARMMGFNPLEIQHLRNPSDSNHEAEVEAAVQSNIDWQSVNWHFKVGMDFIDSLSFITFHSSLLSRLVFDSPFTRPIYRALGREPKKRLS